MTALPPISSAYATRKGSTRAVKRTFVSFSLILSLAALVGAGFLTIKALF